MSETRHTLETLKAKIFNQTLNVFNLAYHVDELREAASREPITLWYLYFPFVPAIEQTWGWVEADRVYRAGLSGAREIFDSIFESPVLIAPDGESADNLVCIITQRQFTDAGVKPAVLGEQIEAQLQCHLKACHPGTKLPVLSGAALLQPLTGMRFERQFYRALQSARMRAMAGRGQERGEAARELDRIIQTKSISTLYQPIVRLGDQAVVGYEALSRGPAGTPYESPEMLFEISYVSEMTYELDRLCQKTALQVAPGNLGGAALFLNASPLSFMHKKFNAKQFCKSVTAAGFEPGQIVIELTERSGIRDFAAFGKVMRELKKAGFKLAIDDVGTGYSSLQTITEIHPDYLKIDMSMIKGIHRSPMKQQIVRSLSNLGKQTAIAVIAEGVEHPDELAELARIDVELAQGHLFAHPAVFGRAAAG
jgi:EAL domain-containing protein (putative c-di-GMP-specific phosphodiesterase class I)